MLRSSGLSVFDHVFGWDTSWSEWSFHVFHFCKANILELIVRICLDVVTLIDHSSNLRSLTTAFGILSLCFTSSHSLKNSNLSQNGQPQGTAESQRRRTHRKCVGSLVFLRDNQAGSWLRRYAAKVAASEQASPSGIWYKYVQVLSHSCGKSSF